MNKYKVNITITGSPWRPPYKGDLQVIANDEQEACQKAKNKLLRGTFMDVSPDAIKINWVMKQF